MSSVENILEPDNNGILDTGEKYGLSTDYDFVTEDSLPQGAVAATAKVPSLRINEVRGWEDFLEADNLLLNDKGQLYSIQQDELIGFIADENVYSDLEGDILEHVNLHENHHLLQYQDGLWGDKLNEEYDLSDGMRHQLNEIDKLMEMREHPVYQHFIDDAKATALIEGYTERVTQAMQSKGEEVGKGFYPGYTKLADYIMKNEYDTDPELEFETS